MIGAIVFFVLLFGYFGIVKGESDSLKVFLAIIGIVAVVWLIGSFSNDNNGMTDADYEKIRIYEENHKDDWKGSVTGEKKSPERAMSDKGALKQGSLLENKKTMKKKKSIHERLKINKEIIAKQQGKDSKAKGVELA